MCIYSQDVIPGVLCLCPDILNLITVSYSLTMYIEELRHLLDMPHILCHCTITVVTLTTLRNDTISLGMPLTVPWLPQYGILIQVGSISHDIHNYDLVYSTYSSYVDTPLCSGWRRTMSCIPVAKASFTHVSHCCYCNTP